jgi:uncharacterized membrane protein
LEVAVGLEILSNHAMTKPRWARSPALLLAFFLFGVPPVLILAACDSGDGTLAAVDPGAVPLDPSYEMVVQILDRNCVPCHKGGGDAPGVNRIEEEDDPDYDSCQGIRAGLDGILREGVEAESMPPGAWPRLTEEEKLVITRWASAGACSPCNPCP